MDLSRHALDVAVVAGSGWACTPIVVEVEAEAADADPDFDAG